MKFNIYKLEITRNNHLRLPRDLLFGFSYIFPQYIFRLQNRNQMIKNSAVLLKEVRSVKRNQTMLSYSTAKDIVTSAKQLKNARSSKLIDVNTFMENKNQKIKNIDVKLQVHQSEINRNNQIIEELNQNFVSLKVHLDKQKENSQNEQKKNKQLRDEIERTNKMLRAKNNRIQELNKKVSDLEKDNESFKILCSKNEEYTKTINTLRNKLSLTEQTILDLKSSLLEKQKQISKNKQKIINLENLRLRQEDINSQILTKDISIGNLKQTINDLQIQKNKQLQDKSNIANKMEKLYSQITALKEVNANLKNSLESSDKKSNQLRQRLENIQLESKQSVSKMRNRDKEQFALKTEISELRIKNEEFCNQLEQKSKKSVEKETKIQKLTQKIKELENNLGQNYKQKDKHKAFEEKIQALKKKIQNLQHLYYSLIPQIQCPFGHELNNPVTIIPCGHNYCLGCKKGYNKECMQCSGKLKIEAVYRNQLMDDIIGMVGGIKQIIEILK